VLKDVVDVFQVVDGRQVTAGCVGVEIHDHVILVNNRVKETNGIQQGLEHWEEWLELEREHCEEWLELEREHWEEWLELEREHREEWLKLEREHCEEWLG